MVHSPHTVVGLFNHPDTAQQAAHQLTQQGFEPDHVDVSDHDLVTTENPTGEFPENDTFHHWLRTLFTSDTDARLRAAATHRGGLVAVHLDTMEEANRARTTLTACGAVDVHELGVGDRL